MMAIIVIIIVVLNILRSIIGCFYVFLLRDIIRLRWLSWVGSWFLSWTILSSRVREFMETDIADNEWLEEQSTMIC